MNTWLLSLENRLARQDTRNARAKKRYEAQARALEYLLKMRMPIHTLFAAAPWSLKKPAGFCLATPSKYMPHQGLREMIRRCQGGTLEWLS
jgi:hypothetical protein